jgi:hypothetical protein
MRGGPREIASSDPGMFTEIIGYTLATKEVELKYRQLLIVNELIPENAG